VQQSAQWVALSAKYDWDAKTTGYCSDESECFVSKEKGCIKNGEYTDGTAIDSGTAAAIGKGNHYCYNGEWRTRTYLMANFLEDVACDTADGTTTCTSFILHCDSPEHVFNIAKPKPTYIDNMESVCTLILRPDNNNEQVIIGYILKDDATKDSTIGLIATTSSGYTSGSLIEDFSLKTGQDAEYDSAGVCLDSTIAALVEDERGANNFFNCVDKDKSGSNPGFKIYYNYFYKFYIVSDETVTKIEGFSFLDRIIGFFSGLFSIARNTEYPEYSLAQYTENFNKLYVLRNSDLKADAVHEVKYDEAALADRNYLYIKYADTDLDVVLNEGYLQSLLKITKDDPNSDSIDFVPTPPSGERTSQEIIIKYKSSLDIWQYLTAMLRDRDLKTE
jgi:hypothetical protein